MSKRILSLDWLRGLAVFGMTAVHVFLNTSELVQQACDDPFSMPPALLVIAVFAVIFSHWRGFFLMISGVVHLYSMVEMSKRGMDRKQILKTQLTFGFALFFFGVFKEAFLNQWSYFYGVMEDGVWDWSYWQFGYFSEALENVGWSIIMTSILFYFLTANEGLEKIKRNIIILVIVAACFLFLAQYVFDVANLISGATATGETLQSGEYHWREFPHWYDYITRLFINQFAGRESPLFPMYVYSLTGTIVGLILTQKDFVEQNKGPKFLSRGFLIGFLFIVVGVLWWIIFDDMSLELNFHVHPTWFVLFSIGLQLEFLLLVMKKNEFNPRVNLETAKRKTLWLRRWGILALTVYALAVIEFIPRYIFDGVGGVDFRHRIQAPFWPMLLMLILVLVMWELIIRFWEKAKFKGSCEWLLLKIGKRSKKMNQDDPLNIQGVLYDVEPVLFVKQYPSEVNPKY